MYHVRICQSRRLLRVKSEAKPEPVYPLDCHSSLCLLLTPSQWRKVVAPVQPLSSTHLQSRSHLPPSSSSFPLNLSHLPSPTVSTSTTVLTKYLFYVLLRSSSFNSARPHFNHLHIRYIRLCWKHPGAGAPQTPHS
jgi:hypothetical protein